MNGSHIIAVNLMLGSRRAWPPANGDQTPEHCAGAELDVRQDSPQDAPPCRTTPRTAKSAWTQVWQRVSCLLD
jgi:hypothetical protein